jgi:hypothetical protein
MRHAAFSASIAQGALSKVPRKRGAASVIIRYAQRGTFYGSVANADPPPVVRRAATLGAKMIACAPGARAHDRRSRFFRA